MTSPVPADDPTVTPIDANKPKKESRRQRIERETSERASAEAVPDGAAAVTQDDQPPVVGEKITKASVTAGKQVDKTTTYQVTLTDVESQADAELESADDTPDADAPDANAPDADAPDADASDADASDADAPDADASDVEADPASIPAETRKQRKARQTIEDAKAEKEAAEAKAEALAAKQAADAAEKQHAAEQAATMKARVRRGTKRWMRRLALLAVVGGIGLGAYLAWPTFNERYVQPVESTAADVDNIQTNVSALQDLTASENQRLAELITGLNSSTEDLAAETAAIQAALDTLTTGQADLVTDQANLVTGQADLEARLGDIETQIGNATRRIDDIDTLAADLGSGLEVVNRSAATQLTVMRATELLSRSRLLLYQANYGLAKADLTAARSALAEVSPTPLTDAAISRIDLAITNLPSRPVAAAGDIDIAWAALLAGTTDAVRPDDSFVPTPADQSGGGDASTTDGPAEEATDDALPDPATPDQ